MCECRKCKGKTKECQCSQCSENDECYYPQYDDCRWIKLGGKKSE